MAKVPVVTALGGADWEADVITAVEGTGALTIARRCVDIVELLAVAASGQARAALISPTLRRLDVDAVDRLLAAEVVCVGVISRDDIEAEHRLAALGVRHVVPIDADPAVLAGVVMTAVEQGVGPGPQRAFADPATATGAVRPPGTAAPPASLPTRRGSVVAVWGPTGAPGRTTVAVGLADEVARLSRSTLLIDADVYGGVIAPTLGLLDESPGLAAACRAASTARLDAAGLAALAWQLNPHLRVLTGIPRADRWPELRASGVEAVLTAARTLAEFTVIDCGFSLETDEELSFDTLAPRRNGATLAVLEQADVVLAVGAADPIGLQRLVRGLGELADAEVTAPVWVVLNRVRSSAVPGDVNRELAAALQRFAGRAPAALLPADGDALDRALSAGKTLAEARPSSALRRALVELAGALAQPSEGQGPLSSTGFEDLAGSGAAQADTGRRRGRRGADAPGAPRRWGRGRSGAPAHVGRRRRPG